MWNAYAIIILKSYGGLKNRPDAHLMKAIFQIYALQCDI